MQRFRGRIYASDHAIQESELTRDGRHRVPADDHSWHVLSVEGNDQVTACLRYTDSARARGFDSLSVRHAALTHIPAWGGHFRNAVETEMERARQEHLRFGEVGGWAVAENHRWTLEPLRIILATYGLLELLGGCAGVATATSRHHSSTILRRLGLRALEWDGVALPPYYDPQYRCDMEVLSFDSRYPNPKYRGWVEELASCLSTAPVVCASNPAYHLRETFLGFETPLAEPALVRVA